MSQTVDYQTLSREGARVLNAEGFEGGGLEARLLLQKACAKSHADLIADAYVDVCEVEKTRFWTYIERRLMHEPIAYICQFKEFFGLEFYVDNRVLIPRPESEMLVDYVLQDGALVTQTYQDNQEPLEPLRILDIGTGSGALLLSCLYHLPQAQGMGVDVSENALKVASKNAEDLGVSTQVKFLCSDFFSALLPAPCFDIIIANPPYICTSDMQTLAPDVLDYEPELALHGGFDGLEAYREIISRADRHLKRTGKIVLEVGAGQAKVVQCLLKNQNFQQINAYADLNGHLRMMCARYGR